MRRAAPYRLKELAPQDSFWKLDYDNAYVEVYEDNRTTIVTPDQTSGGPLSPNPSTFWIEGIAPTTADGTEITFHVDLDGDETFDCSDGVRLTVAAVNLEIGGVAENEEETPPGLKVATNNDFDEGKANAGGVPVADKDDVSPVAADGASIAMNGLIECNASVLPEDDDVLAGSTITIAQTGGTGSVRLFAINPAAAPPFDDDWVSVPPGANLRDDYYLSTGAYNDFDSWVEGVTAGPVELTLSFSMNGLTSQDTVLLNIVEYGVVEIRYMAFIACNAITTGDLPGVTDYFAGDERNFAYGASSSRSFQSYYVSVNPEMVAGEMTNGVRGTREFFGPTAGYNDEPANIVACGPGQVCPTFCTDCITATAVPECTATAVDGQGNTLSGVLTHVTDSLSELALTLDGTNPCESLAPAINAEITFEFRQSYANGVLGPFEWRIKPSSGSWHDAFPWHELYLNGFPEYRFDPGAGGRTPDPWDLYPLELGGEDIWIPTPNHSPWLGEWQPVP